MKERKQFYRVECNFGCKYFKDIDKAMQYFQKKANNRFYVELWQVTYTNTKCKKKCGIYAVQMLIKCTTPITLE